MQKPDADEIALRLLCEAAEDRLDRLDASKLAVKRYSQLPEDAVARMLKEQQARQND